MLVIFIRELKKNVMAFVIWLVALIIFMIAAIAKYKTFSGNAAGLEGIINKIPKALQALTGMRPELNLNVYFDYYIVLYVYVIIIILMYTVLLSASLLTSETFNHTADFLFTKPIKKWQVAFGKFLANFTYVTIFNLVATTTAIVLMYVVAPQENSNNFLLLGFVQWILSLFIMGVCYFFATFVPMKYINILGVCIVLYSYFMYTLYAVNDTFILRLFSPLNYFDPLKNIMQQQPATLFFILVPIATVILLVVGIGKNSQKDIV